VVGSLATTVAAVTSPSPTFAPGKGGVMTVVAAPVSGSGVPGVGETAVFALSGGAGVTTVVSRSASPERRCRAELFSVATAMVSPADPTGKHDTDHAVDSVVRVKALIFGRLGSVARRRQLA